MVRVSPACLQVGVRGGFVVVVVFVVEWTRRCPSMSGPVGLMNFQGARICVGSVGGQEGKLFSASSVQVNRKGINQIGFHWMMDEKIWSLLIPVWSGLVWSG